MQQLNQYRQKAQENLKLIVTFANSVDTKKLERDEKKRKKRSRS